MAENLIWVYVFDLCLSIINLFLLFVVFGSLFKRLGTYHRNFWCILLQIHVALIGITIGNILSGLSMKVENDRPLQKWFIPWKMGNFLSSFSGGLLESGFYSVFIERSLATIKRKSYEKLTAYWFTICLSTMSFIYALALSSMWHIFVLDISVTIPICFGLNILCAICVVFLFYYNRKLRRKEFGTNLKLSQRYQIDENIKLLNNWLPILILGPTFIILNGILSTCGYSFDIGINAYDNNMVYMMVNNLYVFVACLVIIRNQAISSPYFASFLKISSSTVIPRNVLGEKLIISHVTIEQHFNELKRYWT